MMARKGLFGNKRFNVAVPFFLFVIGGSIGLREFTALKYKYRAVESVNIKEEVKKAGIEVRKPEEITLEAQYEELKKVDISNWDNVRVPRPEGWEQS